MVVESVAPKLRPKQNASIPVVMVGRTKRKGRWWAERKGRWWAD